MARKSDEPVVEKVDLDAAEDAEDVEAAREALAGGDPLVSAEDLRVELDLPREVGTVVEEAVLPFERRKDGSIAYFTQEQAQQREVGS